MSLHLDFTAIQAGRLFVDAAKRVLLWYAENSSAAHLMNLFYRLDHFCRSLEFSPNENTEVETVHLISYRASLTARTLWYFSALSGLLKKWHMLGHPGVSRDAADLLYEFRNKGNLRGEAVLTMDPIYGPFSDIELSQINDRLEDRYADQLVSLEQYVLAKLFISLGQRSVQYASLKLVDLVVSDLPGGDREYLLKIPRAKQRGPSRTQFKDRLLIESVGAHLAEHCQSVRERFSNYLPDVSQMPIFPASASRRNEPPGFRHHRTSDSLAITLEETIEGLGITSERTGKYLHVTARRFRRTTGTRAAAEGHGALVIAELLDHSNTHNVDVYINARPEIVERIDRAIALQLAPLAQAFAGVIVERETDAVRGSDPGSRILDPGIAPMERPMGTCGQHGFCGLLAPIACYTCRNFQPWLEGPHESVLAYLLAERERLAKESDLRIASISDRTILAVAQVVLKCGEMGSTVGGTV